MSTPDRAQFVRQAVLEFLAPRQSLTYSIVDIVSRIQGSNLLDFRPEAEEVTAAVAFLLNFKPEPLIVERRAKLGRGIYYQATSAGVLAFERGTLEDSL